MTTHDEVIQHIKHGMATTEHATMTVMLLKTGQLRRPPKEKLAPRDGVGSGAAFWAAFVPYGVVVADGVLAAPGAGESTRTLSANLSAKDAAALSSRLAR